MSFRGDVTPVSAFEALSQDPDAVLVDVRTEPELIYVGLPDLSGIGKRLVTIEWRQTPDGSHTTEFVNELRTKKVDPDASVYFICRSGVRSRFAAVTAANDGYDKTFNVAYGFEGDRDSHGHRGSVAGWKVDGLPWRQA